MRDTLSALCVCLLLPFFALWASLWLARHLTSDLLDNLTDLWFGEDDHAEGVR